MHIRIITTVNSEKIIMGKKIMKFINPWMIKVVMYSKNRWIHLYKIRTVTFFMDQKNLCLSQEFLIQIPKLLQLHLLLVNNFKLKLEINRQPIRNYLHQTVKIIKVGTTKKTIYRVYRHYLKSYWQNRTFRVNKRSQIEKIH